MSAVPGVPQASSADTVGRPAVTVAGGSDHRWLLVAAILALAPGALFVAAGALLVTARAQGFVVGYEAWARSLMTVLALLVPIGLVAAAVVAVRGPLRAGGAVAPPA
ncbi:MAG TPA: hypothetical protein VK576_00400, partial [Thermoleophilia bacterium]|nr:hypothetical protein [Thermoleophilia bacterium]